jgi:hypothetical protein
MRDERLGIAWVCNDCNTVFIFQDDLELHQQRFLHNSISAYDINTGRLLEKSQEQGMKHLSERARDELR